MAMSFYVVSERWAFGIGPLRRDHLGRTDVRRGLSDRSGGIALTMSLCFGEQHLRHVLNSYQKYCNEARTHLSLHKDAPITRAVQTVGQTLAVPILGGLHHQYLRV